MPKKPGTAVSRSSYDGVIVGIRTATSTVEQIWLQKDGGMLAGGHVHYPPEGKTAAGEALLVFGLTTFRIFRSSASAAVAAYSARLEAELDAERPPPPPIF